MSFKSLLFLSSLLGQTSFNEAAAGEFENGDVVRVKDTEIHTSLEDGFARSLRGPEPQTLPRKLRPADHREDSKTASCSLLTLNATVELLISPAWTKYQNDINIMSQLLEHVQHNYGDFGDNLVASAISNLTSFDKTLRDFKETVVTANRTLAEARNDYLNYRIEREEFQKRIFPIAEHVHSISRTLLDQTDVYSINFEENLDSLQKVLEETPIETFVGNFYNVDFTPKLVLAQLHNVRIYERSFGDNYYALLRLITYYISDWIDLHFTELND